MPAPAPLADGDDNGPRGLIRGVAFSIGLRVAQPVQMRHRNRRQPLVCSLAVFVVFALQNAPCRRSAQVSMRLVDVGQQIQVGGGITARETGAPISYCLHSAGLAVCSEAPCYLGAAQARHPRDVAPHQPPLGPLQARVLLADQRPFHPAVHLVAPLPGKPGLAGTGQKRPNLLQAHSLRGGSRRGAGSRPAGSSALARSPSEGSQSLRGDLIEALPGFRQDRPSAVVFLPALHDHIAVLGNLPP